MSNTPSRDLISIGAAILASMLTPTAAAAHESHEHVEFVRSTPPTTATQSDGSPRVSLAGEVVVIEDDGSLIRDGRFVLSRILPAFYGAVPDSFEFLSLFGASTFREPMVESATQYLVRQDTEGLGRVTGLDRSGALGVRTTRLRSIQLMNDLRHFGPSPTAPIPRFARDFTGVELLASEAMHAYGCWIELEGVNLLGRLGAHWSFFLDSGASVMEGCRWRDNGDGSFTSVAVLEGFSELDEYLLGLRPASEVSPMCVITDPDPVPPAGEATVPFSGFTTRGRKVDFTIEDVIAQNGLRVPAASEAPKRFRMAFVLVVPIRTTPSASDVQFVDRFRSDWEEYFHRETEGLGTMVTTIPRERPHADFVPDLVAGNAPLTVRFDDLSNGTITDRRWRFGKGTAHARDLDPVFTFEDEGIYTVRLRAIGPAGESTRTLPALVRVGGFERVAYVDFEASDGGWGVGAPNNARTGRWQWGVPEGTYLYGAPAQSSEDFTPTGSRCWVTGPGAGATPSANDVDSGFTTLYSPGFDLSDCVDPHVSYARWFSNHLGANPGEDRLDVEVTSTGEAGWTLLESVTEGETHFRRAQFRIAEFVPLSEEVRFRFRVSDLFRESVVEAAVDDFEILDARERRAPPARGLGLKMTSARPNPFSVRTGIRYHTERPGPVSVRIFDPAGRLVRVLGNAADSPGAHEVVWDGRDAHGRVVASGVYAVRIETPSEAASQSLVLIR